MENSRLASVVALAVFIAVVRFFMIKKSHEKALNENRQY